MVQSKNWFKQNKSASPCLCQIVTFSLIFCKRLMYSSRKHPYSPQTGGWIFLGWRAGISVGPKHLKKFMKPYWNFEKVGDQKTSKHFPQKGFFLKLYFMQFMWTSNIFSELGSCNSYSWLGSSAQKNLTWRIVSSVSIQIWVIITVKV